MQVIKVDKDLRNDWDEFVTSHAIDGGFLQSWGWGDFQKALGRQVFRLAVLDEESNLVGAILLVKIEIHFEYNYLYSARGPVVSSKNSKVVEALLKEVKKLAKEEKSFLVRMDPAWRLVMKKVYLVIIIEKVKRRYSQNVA